MRCPECGKQISSSAKLCPNCKRPVIVAASKTSGNSRYSGILKPHATVSIKGAGSRMTGNTKVVSVRHNITTSDKSKPSIGTRCIRCGTVNDKDAKVCRRCRVKISS